MQDLLSLKAPSSIQPQEAIDVSLVFINENMLRAGVLLLKQFMKREEKFFLNSGM
jgi:hypothetical protein